MYKMQQFNALQNTDMAWLHFIKDGTISQESNKITPPFKKQTVVPTLSPIYISTKTIIAFLNNSVDLIYLFWNTDILSYYQQKEGIIKKQMKFVCTTKKESDILKSKLNNILNKEIHQIQFINNPNAQLLKYKDVQKVSIGFSKKDILTKRKKPKGAFYNCIVYIIRINCEGIFKEYHLKIFNTGKLEIPGIKSDKILTRLLLLLIKHIQPLCPKPLRILQDKTHTVLINSNFSCNFYIDRDKLFNILKYKYKLSVHYDPCSYPGIQAKFAYNLLYPENKGICKCQSRCTKKGSGDGENQCKIISFMIFRTGSILVVGNCNDELLTLIYKFISNILCQEYLNIYVNDDGNYQKKKNKKKKRKKMDKRIIIQNL